MSKFLDYPGLEHYTEKVKDQISQLGLEKADLEVVDGIVTADKTVGGYYVNFTTGLITNQTGRYLYYINAEGIEAIKAHVGFGSATSAAIAFYTTPEVSSDGYMLSASLQGNSVDTDYYSLVPQGCKLIVVVNNSSIIANPTITLLRKPLASEVIDLEATVKAQLEEPSSPNLYAVTSIGKYLSAGGSWTTNSAYNSCLLPLEPGATYRFVMQVPASGGGNYVRIFQHNNDTYKQVQGTQSKTPVIYTCPNDGNVYYGQMVEGASVTNPKPEIYKINSSVAYKVQNLTSVRNQIKILFIGNSHSRDVFSYVPSILESIVPGIDITMGILYKGSATLSNHYDYINNGTPYEAYDKYTTMAGMWTTTTDTAATTADVVLAEEQWDMIVLQQRSIVNGNYSTFQPYANDIIDLIFGKITYSTQIGWNMTFAVADEYSGQPDGSSDAQFANIVTATQNLLKDTPFQFVFPVATAIQNARQTSLKSLGTFGDMTYDGLHLQDGLPCMVGAYAGVLKILELMGIKHRGILGNQIRATTAFLTSQAIPQTHGTSTGVTDANCLIAQKCALLAQSNPFEITM